MVLTPAPEALVKYVLVLVPVTSVPSFLLVAIPIKTVMPGPSAAVTVSVFNARPTEIVPLVRVATAKESA